MKNSMCEVHRFHRINDLGELLSDLVQEDKDLEQSLLIRENEQRNMTLLEQYRRLNVILAALQNGTF